MSQGAPRALQSGWFGGAPFFIVHDEGAKPRRGSPVTEEAELCLAAHWIRSRISDQATAPVTERAELGLGAVRNGGARSTSLPE